MVSRSKEALLISEDKEDVVRAGVMRVSLVRLRNPSTEFIVLVHIIPFWLIFGSAKQTALLAQVSRHNYPVTLKARFTLEIERMSIFTAANISNDTLITLMTWVQGAEIGENLADSNAKR